MFFGSMRGSKVDGSQDLDLLRDAPLTAEVEGGRM